MAKMICTTCDFIYDEFYGGPAPGIEPGTTWDELPEKWHCPQCGEPKSGFEPLQTSDKASEE